MPAHPQGEEAMSKPTVLDLETLKKAQGDDERYHVYFDRILEERIAELDPEWMKAMRDVYDKSGMGRWCA